MSEWTKTVGTKGEKAKGGWTAKRITVATDKSGLPDFQQKSQTVRALNRLHWASRYWSRSDAIIHDYDRGK